jgi:hypothetical protein
MPRPSVLVFTLAILALVANGCQSSGIKERRARKGDVYRAFDAETRKLVDKGRIQNGMDTNAVFIAWGTPTDSFSMDVPGGGQRLIWNYEEKWAYEKKEVVVKGNSYGKPIYGVETRRIPITYLKKSVTFAAGKVVQWKRYDPPVLNEPLKTPPNSPRLL